MSEPNPCVATNCILIELPLERCERERCCFAWARRSREDRARREAKDRQLREEGVAG